MAAPKMKRCMFCGDNYTDAAQHLQKQCWKEKQEKKESETNSTGE